MAVRREDTASELKDVKLDCYWLPETPAKPDSTRQQPICTNWQENHTIQPNQVAETNCYGSARLVEDFLQEAQSQRLSSSFGLQNPYNSSNSDFNTWQRGESSDSHIHGDNLHTWQACEAANSRVNGEDLSIYNEFSIHDADKWTNMSFGSLLALAHGLGSTTIENVDVQSDFIATASTSLPNFRPQIEGSLSKKSTGSTFPPYIESLLGTKSNMGFNNAPDILTADGSSIPLRPFFDLNTPLTDASSSKSILSQFEPITPEKTNKKEYMRADLSIDEVPAAKDKQENNIEQDEVKELQEENKKSQLVANQLNATTSTQLQENHKPDKGGTEDADLSKTPQQKPRRRKHRPKVIIEGRSKSTPKRSTEKHTVPQETTSAKRKYTRTNRVENLTNTPLEVETGGAGSKQNDPDSKDTPVGKRKYVRRKGVDKHEYTMDKGTPETADKKTSTRSRRTCRRSLNFNLENEMRDESSSNISSSNCDMESQENLDAKDQSTTVHVDQSGYTRGKCQIIFSDASHNKEANTAKVTVNPDSQWTLTDTNDSIGSSACMTPERQARCLKRQHMGTTAEAELYNGNTNGTFYNSFQAYGSIFSQNADKNDSTLGMHFPAIYKRKRTGKGHNMEISSLQYVVNASDNQVQLERQPVINSCAKLSTSRANQGSSVAQSEGSNLLMNNPATHGIHVQNERQFFASLLALGPAERIKKKRSKGPTRVRDLASLLEICKELPALPSRAATSSRIKQGIAILHEPHTCMRALVADARSRMTTKKRSKRSMLITSTVQNIYTQHEFPGPPLAITWKCVSPIESITEQLNQLELNRESSQVRAQTQNAFMASYHMLYQEPGALVPYQKSGAVIPFNSSFDQVRRRKPRPKVDLDDETTRVWKLLLENINSEGIDGTDEEKAKWWEEERRVFNGRADSFIARMHLVQGDRQFSPWKGSVIDSVVGVFLTQNVSDHLSSSAFMSLAARFPLQSETNLADSHEERVSTKIGEPEVCLLDSDSGLEKDVPNKPVSDEDAETLYIFEDDGIKLVEESGNKSMSLTTECGKDIDDALSSQTSVISSQNSADSPNAQSTERAESCSLSTLEEKPKSGVDPSRFGSSTSFVKLLQMAGSVLHGVYGNECEKGSDESEQVQSENSSLCSEDDQKSSPNAHTSSNGQNEKNQKIVENQTGQVPQKIIYQENNYKMHEISNIPSWPQNLIDVTGSSSNIDYSRKSQLKEVKSNKDPEYHTGKTVNGTKARGERIRKEKQNSVDWDELRKQAQAGGRKREGTANTMDSADWDAVRCADVSEIAHTIRDRGMNNKLAERIKDFLNRLVRDHGSIDLEWLRDVPPDKAKEYLLSIRGLGLKSVECVRLLTLHHLAFPVDTNVGRIAVRLGWVPLQPLPESLQLHLLELYPVLESIQQYLWPRLCKLDQKTLYELHYQMITFGKVFCTKNKPNCNACPMRGECRHFASAFASARLALPAPAEKSIVSATETKTEEQNPMRSMNTLQLPSPQANQMVDKSGASNSQPIIEEPATPEPIIEVPASPEPSHTQVSECDIENSIYEDPDEIPTIHLNMEVFTQNLQKIMEQNTELLEGDMSKALVALTREAASIPVPKLKNMSRLRTEHQVYELPDSHPLLQGMDKREPDDPSPYLLAIWTPGETVDSIEPPQRMCSSQESEGLCTDEKCLSCNSLREANSNTVRGTLLIPCRTAMRGSFPLNGTYFQVNEVFSDHESSLAPIDVPREWLWNLPRRTVYFGTSIPTIFKGLSTEGIQYCFWRGFVCVRGFDRKTRAPRPLIARLHFPASKLAKGKGKTDEN
ncbi:hypothetical protein BUALT_Bualt11G0101600 [Buddleja alternifolia]|uniref:HhH-GPD domain-containing protein n=1 Tax=Buddleja alternifolia TaxID=168488 RepID=A0AAV6X0B7_9LAMI|nr:hypothetical protein BUALT_Bualt11G0101600 [Buddleja alternifolia]